MGDPTAPKTHRIIPNARFILKTPPIIEALEDFIKIIEFRDTGAYLAAPQRWGKTRASRYLCSAIRKLFGPIPVTFVPLRAGIRPGISPFFKYILNLSRYKYTSKSGRTEVEIRNLLTDCIVSRARRCAHKMYILVIDEAQKLTTTQWEFIFELSNEVDGLGVNLVVLSIGQLALEEAEEQLLADGREEISERFLQRRLRFRGLLTEIDLKFVLERLEQAMMPGDNEISYLNSYCPKALAGGWRLSCHASELWHEFAQLYCEAGVQRVELPMTYVMNTVNKLLVALSKRDSHPLVVPEGVIRECVRTSGVKSSIKSYLRSKERLIKSGNGDSG